ncbi:MAG: hypothetical protein QE271_00330, partial [Bacteriovoracaceae bacterium]|nr:hypothetical protein [Bacteriovoracaceae bacterium]
RDYFEANMAQKHFLGLEDLSLLKKNKIGTMQNQLNLFFHINLLGSYHQVIPRNDRKIVSSEISPPETIVFEDGKKYENAENDVTFTANYSSASVGLGSSTSIIDKMIGGSMGSILPANLGYGVTFARSHNNVNSQTNYSSAKLSKDVTFRLAKVMTHFDARVTSCFAVRSMKFSSDPTPQNGGEYIRSTYLGLQKLYFFCLYGKENEEYIHFNENFYFSRESRNSIYQEEIGSGNSNELGLIVDFRGDSNLINYQNLLRNNKGYMSYFDAVNSVNELLGLPYYKKNKAGDYVSITNEFYRFNNYDRVIKAF